MVVPLIVTVPETVGHFGAVFGGRGFPRRTARSYAATGSDNSKPSRPLQAHCVSPNPFSGIPNMR